MFFWRGRWSRIAELKAQVLQAEHELSSLEETPQIIALDPATLDSYIATVDRLAAVLTDLAELRMIADRSSPIFAPQSVA